MRTRSLEKVLFGCTFLMCALAATPALAFKVMTHVATANRALDRLQTVVTSTPGANTLVFEVKGKRLEVQVTAKEAYLAILAHSEFFRGGAIGPDGFPDIITGQYWQHSNQNRQASDLVTKLTGVIPVDHLTTDKAETRVGTSEFRSVDFAMALFEFLQTGGYAFAGEERAQALAFVLGYFAHGVGDSFAHAWVNDYAGGAWELGVGQGIFGPLTEEIKHVSVETLTETRVPGNLQNTDGSVGGELNRMDVRAPTGFLDAFFSREVPGARPFGSKSANSPNGYLDYFKQTDRFFGSALYNYFNFQVSAAAAIKNWSGASGYMNFAEQWRPGPFLNVLLDIVDFPNQVEQEVESWIGGDLVPFLTGGYLKCELFHGDTTGLDAIRAVWDYLGGFNDRVRHFEEKARVVRRNWLRLSECTAQNLVRIHGGEFDETQPSRHRDACAALAERPFVDQGDPLGLYRGNIREGNEDDNEFLTDLRNYFRGLDDDGNGVLERAQPFEVDNGHRKIGPNLKRMRSYLFGFSFVLDDLEDVVITDKAETSFDHACGLVRDPAEKRCLNLQLLPYAMTYRQGKCLVEESICIGQKVAECVSHACKSACSFLPEICIDLGLGRPCIGVRGPCNGLCDLSGAACRGAVGGVCGAMQICIPNPFGDDLCAGVADECNDLLRPMCSVLDGTSDCAADLFDCAAEGIDCHLDALELIFLNEGWADKILSPIAGFCDSLDKVRNIVDRFDTVEERASFLEAVGFPVRQLQEVEDLLGEVSDSFPKFPAAYFVNVAFSAEDLRSSPEYLARYLDALAKFEQQNNALPAGDVKARRQEAARRLRALADAARSSGASVPPLVDISLDGPAQALSLELDAFKSIADRAAKDPTNLNTYVVEFSKKLAEFDDTSAGLPAGELKRTRDEASARLHAWLDATIDAARLGTPPPPLLKANLDPLFAIIDNEILTFEEILDSTVIPTTEGPTAVRILRDIGPDMPVTFNQFFNVVQGLTLIPLTSEGDVTTLFTKEAVPTDRLPWNQAPLFSNHCHNGSPMILFCDALPSFDDPNCKGPLGQGCRDKAPLPERFNWIAGRGLVAWNPYDPSGTTPKNVLTNFPLAASQDVYDKLYTRVFDVPQQVPAFSGFEDASRPWTGTPAGRISPVTTEGTQGTKALSITGCGATTLTSPLFTTPEFEIVGSTLSLDVKLPTAQANPWWLGQVQLFVSVPAANIVMLPIGVKDLTPLKPLGVWKTVDFAVPTNVQSALLEVHANAQFTIAFTASGCAGPAFIDNLRFTGTLRPRTQFKETLIPLAPSTLFGFESTADWQATGATLGREATRKVQGSASLAVATSGSYAEVVSRKFSNADAGAVKGRLKVDVLAPLGSPPSGGGIQGFLNCPSLGIYNAWLGRVPINDFFPNEFNAARLLLPEWTTTLLKTRSYADCTIRLALSADAGRGTFLLDNLSFVE